MHQLRQTTILFQISEELNEEKTNSREIDYALNKHKVRVKHNTSDVKVNSLIKPVLLTCW